jgi:hypothetical protein
MNKILYFIVFLLIESNLLFGQSEWDIKYKPKTIDIITKPYDNYSISKSQDFTFDDLFKKYRIIVKYGDSIRPISDVDKLFIEYLPGLDSSFKILFQDEILCFEDGKKYWIYTQKQLIENFKSELKNNDYLFLYVIYLGYIDKDNKRKYIFIANDFRKIE